MPKSNSLKGKEPVAKPGEVFLQDCISFSCSNCSFRKKFFPSLIPEKPRRKKIPVRAVPEAPVNSAETPEEPMPVIKSTITPKKKKAGSGRSSIINYKSQPTQLQIVNADQNEKAKESEMTPKDSPEKSWMHFTSKEKFQEMQKKQGASKRKSKVPQKKPMTPTQKLHMPRKSTVSLKTPTTTPTKKSKVPRKKPTIKPKLHKPQKKKKSKIKTLKIKFPQKSKK